MAQHAMPRVKDLSCARRLFASIARRPVEVGATAYLDPDGRLLGMRHTAGAGDAVTLEPRTLALDALAFGAWGVVIAHNHPSGDARPSGADLAHAKRAARALDAVAVRLLDHLVLTGRKVVSLRELGLL